MTTVVTVIALEWAINPESSLMEPVLVVSAIQIDADFFPILLLDGTNPASGFQQPPFDLTVHNWLHNARVTGSVLAVDVVSDSHWVVEIDLTWDSTGPLMIFNGHSHESEGGTILLSNFHGKAREAVATGSVLVNGENLTPMPSSPWFIQEIWSRDTWLYR